MNDPSNSFAAKIIDWSVGNRFFVMLGVCALLVAGIVSIQNIPLDAIPDLSDTQVIIRTDWPGLLLKFPVLIMLFLCRVMILCQKSRRLMKHMVWGI